jgi:hypothetical protein
MLECWNDSKDHASCPELAAGASGCCATPPTAGRRHRIFWKHAGMLECWNGSKDRGEAWQACSAGCRQHARGVVCAAEAPCAPVRRALLRDRVVCTAEAPCAPRPCNALRLAKKSAPGDEGRLSGQRERLLANRGTSRKSVERQILAAAATLILRSRLDSGR